MPESALERLIAVASELRRRCPWDRAQTIKSLSPFILEESYELADSIASGDKHNVREELGDLLYLVILCCVICGESKGFGIDEVAKEITQKMVTRHPAVFGGDEKADTSDPRTWYRLKKKNDEEGRRFSGIPKNLPALLRAEKVQYEASSVGFDWKSAGEVIQKIGEELGELKNAIEGKGDVAHELGDLLFSTVNLSRFLEVNAELALISCVERFCRRFSAMEEEMEKQGRSLEEATLEEMDAVWDKCKDVKREAKEEDSR